ncbi:hypothetical protein C8R44DRAFT_877884 [Mycena epipterygia]|nr:hypothetical protein C8R44DRAFT_877884 [Mycena epipterygia]
MVSVSSIDACTISMHFKVNAASMMTFLIAATMLQLVTSSAIPSSKATSSVIPSSTAGEESDFEEPQPLAWLLSPAVE